MATPGKLVRPLLLIQAHALGAQNPQLAIPAAYAVELFHNFTLVHDDLMDAADMRRNRPTVHIKFDDPTAILAGDAMLIHAYGYLLDHYPGELGAKLLRTFSNMAKALCGGQQRDMDMERDPGASFAYADYLTMIAGKTGILITTCLEMGGIIGELSEHQLSLLRRGGDAAGRAFQILDDVLDTFSAGSVIGKMDQGDIQRGKLSAPYFRAMDLADPAERARLSEIYRLSAEARLPMIPEVIGLFEKHQVESSLRAEAKALTDQALEAFEALGGNDVAREALCRSVSDLLRRAY